MTSILALGGAAVSLVLPTPYPMWANRFESEARQVRGDFEINVIWLQNQGSEPVVLVALDALYAGRELIDRVHTRIEGVVSADCLVFCASHTHFGPILSSDKSGLGVAQGSDAVETVARTIANAIVEARESVVGVSSLTLRQRKVGSVVNRRRKRKLVLNRSGLRTNQIIMAPNVEGSTNDLATVVEFVDERGGVAAVIWQWTCHPTGFPEPGVATPEYPGFVRDYLRRHYENPSLPVVFLQGFSGNQRPPEPTKPRSFGERIAAACRGPVFQPFSKEGYELWLAKVFQDFGNLLESQPLRIDPLVVHGSSKSPIANFLKSETPLPDLNVHRIGLAKNLGITGVSAEVVLEMSRLVDEVWSSAENLCVGCVGDVYGYMPTSSMVPQGGYEVDGFCAGFGYGSSTPGEDVDAAFKDALFKAKESEERNSTDFAGKGD